MFQLLCTLQQLKHSSSSETILGNWASHEVQWLQVLVISAAMFGQNMLFSALRLIDDVPWWAEWRADSTLSLSDSGTTILSPM